MSSQEVVKVFHHQALPTNSAAVVSLILLGLQTVWAHSEGIGRAPHASSPSIQNMGVGHRGADVPVPKQFLNCPSVIAIFQ